MTTTGWSARRVLAGVCLVGLVPGCQTSAPEPGPPVILPTPVLPSAPNSQEGSAAPSPTASESAQMAEAEANRAATIYFEGRQFADALYRENPPRYSPELEEYFSGPYLDFWEQDLASFAARGLEVDGEIRIDVSGASQVDDRGGRRYVSLTACLDFSETRTLDPEGQEVDRGFEYLVDTVYMVRSPDDDWKADGANSEEVESFDGTDCEYMS